MNNAHMTKAVSILDSLRRDMQTVRDYPARLAAGERKEMFDLFIGRIDEAINELTQTTTKEN